MPAGTVWRNMDDSKHGRPERTSYTVRSVVTIKQHIYQRLSGRAAYSFGGKDYVYFSRKNVEVGWEEGYIFL